MELIVPKATDSLETWLSYLEKSHFKPIDMGLARIRDVAETLNLRKPAPYVITVAGTNGKGSTCKLLEVALLNRGLKVGVYSSPHLIHYNERVRVQGQSVSDADLIQSFDFIEKNRSQSLTYFEFGTLAALDIFQKKQVDIAILEVGLGGRLDATNIVDANLAVITSIDIDHVEFLGDNREAIGREKAGIFRRNIPVVIGEPNCPQSIVDYANELHCAISQRDRDWHYAIKEDHLHWQSATETLILPLPKIPAMNCATAIAALKSLPFQINDHIMIESVQQAQMPGRFQRLEPQALQKIATSRPLAQVIVDVGHNPHAARYLAERLHALKQPNQRIFALFSALEDKDLSGIVEPLSEVIDEWHCAGLHGFRGQSADSVLTKLKSALPQAKTMGYFDVATAADQLFRLAGEKDMIIVFGSFHTVADFMHYLE